MPGLALADHHGRAVPAPPANPTSASQIQNIDQVKTAIKAYYGDTVTSTPNPVDNGAPIHQFNPDGAYAHEVEGIAADAGKYLGKQARKHHEHHGDKAILFDIDDTTLNTYSYEIYSNFVYNPTTNAAFVNAGSADVFPAVPGMVEPRAEGARQGLHGVLPDRSSGHAAAGTLANLRTPATPSTRTTCTSRTPDDRAVAAVLRPDVHDDPVQVRDPRATSSRRATTSSPTSVTSSAT